MKARWSSKKPYSGFDIYQAIGDLKRLTAKMENASKNMDRVFPGHKYSAWRRKFGKYYTEHFAVLLYIYKEILVKASRDHDLRNATYLGSEYGGE